MIVDGMGEHVVELEIGHRVFGVDGTDMAQVVVEEFGVIRSDQVPPACAIDSAHIISPLLYSHRDARTVPAACGLRIGQWRGVARNPLSGVIAHTRAPTSKTALQCGARQFHGWRVVVL
jgi:hypothetical protein